MTNQALHEIALSMRPPLRPSRAQRCWRGGYSTSWPPAYTDVSVRSAMRSQVAAMCSRITRTAGGGACRARARPTTHSI
jgi:hypothetical protein